MRSMKCCNSPAMCLTGWQVNAFAQGSNDGKRNGNECGRRRRSRRTEWNAPLQKLPTDRREEFQNAVQEVHSAHQDEIKLLHDTARSCTIHWARFGTTAAAFAHQTKHPLSAIVQDANALEEWLGDLHRFVEFYRIDSMKAAKRIKIEADAIYTFASVTLKLLRT